MLIAYLTPRNRDVLHFREDLGHQKTCVCGSLIGLPSIGRNLPAKFKCSYGYALLCLSRSERTNAVYFTELQFSIWHFWLSPHVKQKICELRETVFINKWSLNLTL